MSPRLLVGPTSATRQASDQPRVISDAEIHDAQAAPAASGRWAVHAPGGLPVSAFIGRTGRSHHGVATVEVVVDGWRFELEVEDADRAKLRRRATRTIDAATTSGPTEIRAIIPGRVATIRVVVGDTVESGQGLLVVEAMKMQNELRAPRAGVVERVAVGEGQTIDNGDVLVVLR